MSGLKVVPTMRFRTLKMVVLLRHLHAYALRHFILLPYNLTEAIIAIDKYFIDLDERVSLKHWHLLGKETFNKSKRCIDKIGYGTISYGT